MIGRLEFLKRIALAFGGAEAVASLLSAEKLDGLMVGEAVTETPIDLAAPIRFRLLDGNMETVAEQAIQNVFMNSAGLIHCDNPVFGFAEDTVVGGYAVDLGEAFFGFPHSIYRSIPRMTVPGGESLIVEIADGGLIHLYP